MLQLGVVNLGQHLITNANLASEVTCVITSICVWNYCRISRQGDRRICCNNCTCKKHNRNSYANVPINVLNV